MISFVIGGIDGELKFEEWVKRTVKFVKRFNTSNRGDLARFSMAIQESCLKIVHKSYHGDIISSGKANDCLLVHIKNKDSNAGDHYIALARDAELDVQIIEYKESDV